MNRLRKWWWGLSTTQFVYILVSVAMLLLIASPLLYIGLVFPAVLVLLFFALILASQKFRGRSRRPKDWRKRV